MPAILELEGWEEQARLTEEWLQGKYEIPEIEDKWERGPIVSITLDAPERVAPSRTPSESQTQRLEVRYT